MPVRIRPTGRELYGTPQRPPTELLAAGDVVDPNDSSLYYNGLGFDRLNPGQEVLCHFTVNHQRTAWNLLGAIPGSDTFTGAITDSNGFVILLLSSYKITLNYGNYGLVRLQTIAAQGAGPSLPMAYAGQTIGVTVGPSNLLNALVIGQPVVVSGGVLTTTGDVPAVASGPPTIPPQPPNFLLDAAVAVGGLAVLGAGAAAVIRHRREEMYR